MKKKLFLFFMLVITAAMLGGCSGVANQTGFFYDFFVRPFAWLIHEIGIALGGNFGLALIIITLLIRLVLMPFMLKTYKNQQLMKVKMDKLKPEMEEIQKRSKQAKNQEEQQKIQLEMMELYKKHGVNPLNMGCLPILIQMPILMGLYYAIRSSKEIASHTFLWFNLGHSDMIMTILAGLVYFAQAQVSLATVPEEQKKQMRLFSYMSPVMIIFISLNAPAALPLYWAVGGIFLIIQTYIGRKYYMQHPEKAKE
ncbi:membrane protein insertase YidC [Siminovitchia fortis]|uniref:Membrane protein insertase YidC n=1 Tax=Siminovitchia fortis TaxID=254758 RepID=A0A443IN81_9BACI|nr:membrane protein insertase YidC [Siminovitchia fortis]RWR07521.1 membrane protein insertase YidC [Siminovitchia fortis]WHY81602.1 membrane protein insertase YidC [Siminovitchia fortis]